MPDLGKYAFEVLTAYAVSLTLLGLLIGWTLLQGSRARQALRDYEARRKAEEAKSEASASRDAAE
ncbi:heme exporter protein CcmD [Tropicimonas sp. S265A]|uniref:heme exporter protein CcmD n=1 Tax=Tropicimonas sp. S265A TaxID=3415134 RepID=UPI003C7BB22F